MATIQEELDLAFVEVGTQFKAIGTLIGALSSLTTTDKANLVSAINEINAKTASAGAQIDDETTRTSTVYSSTKVEALVDGALLELKNEILGGAGPTVDTLKEIADLLASSDSDVLALTTAVGNRLRFDETQTLTVPQKAQGNSNLGSVSLVQMGDPNHSYRDTFLAALT